MSTPTSWTSTWPRSHSLVTLLLIYSVTRRRCSSLYDDTLGTTVLLGVPFFLVWHHCLPCYIAVTLRVSRVSALPTLWLMLSACPSVARQLPENGSRVAPRHDLCVTYVSVSCGEEKSLSSALTFWRPTDFAVSTP